MFFWSTKDTKCVLSGSDGAPGPLVTRGKSLIARMDALIAAPSNRTNSSISESLKTFIPTESSEENTKIYDRPKIPFSADILKQAPLRKHASAATKEGTGKKRKAADTISSPVIPPFQSHSTMVSLSSPAPPSSSSSSSSSSSLPFSAATLLAGAQALKPAKHMRKRDSHGSGNGTEKDVDDDKENEQPVLTAQKRNAEISAIRPSDLKGMKMHLRKTVPTAKRGQGSVHKGEGSKSTSISTSKSSSRPLSIQSAIQDAIHKRFATTNRRDSLSDEAPRTPDSLFAAEWE